MKFYRVSIQKDEIVQIKNWMLVNWDIGIFYSSLRFFKSVWSQL